MSSNIPYELFMVILSKVPAEALLRFRCVCKAWCRMIDDPYLINIHRDHQLRNIHDFSYGVGRILMVNRDDHKLRSLSLNLFNSNNYSPKYSETAHIISYPMMFQEMGFVSCNDLILVWHYHDHDDMHMLSIRNPLTQEVHVLPYDDGVKSLPYGSAYSFGYDSVSDDYKVLTHSSTLVGGIYNYTPYSLYSLKSNSWKQINYDSSHSISHLYPGVCYNGALHWIGRKLPVTVKSTFVIIAFDLKTEDFRYYSLPASIVSRLTNVDLNLGELGGCLSLSGRFDRVHFETWSMNNYGDENSWSMLFSIAKWEHESYLKAISYSKSKGIVLFMKDEFLLFDLKNNTFENISTPNGLYIYSPTIFVASLVQINGGK